MKRGILILGSIVAVLILICASFPSVASSQAVESGDMLQHVRDRIKNKDWKPCDILLRILVFIVGLIGLLLYYVGIMEFPGY